MRPLQGSGAIRGTSCCAGAARATRRPRRLRATGECWSQAQEEEDFTAGRAERGRLTTAPPGGRCTSARV